MDEHDRELLIRLDQKLTEFNEKINSHIINTRDEKTVMQSDIKKLREDIGKLSNEVSQNTLLTTLGRGVLWVFAVTGLGFMADYLKAHL